MSRAVAGFTLVELLVALAIMALAAGLVTVTITTLQPPEGAELLRTIADAREAAIRDGLPVTVELGADTRVIVYPDGSATPTRFAIAGQRWEIDPWTAEVSRVP